jgi:hypothetical protein
VHIPYDLNSIADIPVKDQTASDWKVPNACGDVVSCSAQFGILREHAALPLEKIEESICRCRIVTGDIGPDFY